jgi:hypothetical protein
VTNPASLRILVPEATTNYIKNPAFRYDTTDWNAVGATLTRSLDFARFNIASLKVATAGAALHEGTYYRVNALSGIKEPITVSIYARGNAGQEKVRIRLINNPSGHEWASDAVSLSATRWTRLEITGFSTGSDDLRLYIESDDEVARVITIYVDGAQMERKAYSTTYCDGDQPGCRWNVVSHATISTRDASTREGGKWLGLAGPARASEDIYVTVMSGLGMAPLTNSVQPWGLAPGSYYQSTKINDRVVTLTFNIKHEENKPDCPPDISSLHQLRQQLIDIFKPDRTKGGEAFLIEYQAGDYPIYGWMRYEAGLEGEWDIRNPWTNIFAVRLLAVEPLVTEDNQEVNQLDFLNTLSEGSFSTFLIRKNGAWQLGEQNFGAVRRFAIGPKGEIYCCSYESPYISIWDGTDWNGVGGLANGPINDVAIAPNGDLYVIGAFTSIGGVAANRVAKWNGTAWNALSTGLDAEGYAICIASNGQVYVGGDFASAGGFTVHYIARWDGIQWRTVGLNSDLGPIMGVNNTVRRIINGLDEKTLYVGGDFNEDGAGNSYPEVLALNIDTNLFTNIGGFGDFTVLDLAIGKDGRLYAAGDFQTAYGTGEDILCIAVYNGRKWSQVGDGANGSVHSISIGPDGSIYATGEFTAMGALSARLLARWTGGAWCPVDLEPQAGIIFGHGILAHPNGDIYVGFEEPVTHYFVSGITVVHNSGTAEVSPMLYVKGPGNLRRLENQTSGKCVYFNLTIQDEEEVFIDFGKRKIESTVRGSLLWSLLAPSDFASFALLPGDNVIAAFMMNDVNTIMQMSYVPAHWSMDATVKPEALA